MKEKILITIIVITFILGGCSIISPESYTKDKLKEQGDAAIDYISEKYGERFTPVTYGLGDYFSDTDIVECYPSWMDPEKEHVNVYIHSDGSFGDDYFQFYKRVELENRVKSYIEPEFGDDVKVYIGFSECELPAELTVNSSVEDLYMADPGFLVGADIFVKVEEKLNDDEFSKKIESVKETLCKTGKSYIVHIYLIDFSIYETISRYDTSSVMNVYQKKWKADGKAVKNAADFMIFSGKIEE